MWVQLHVNGVFFQAHAFRFHVFVVRRWVSKARNNCAPIGLEFKFQQNKAYEIFSWKITDTLFQKKLPEHAFRAFCSRPSHQVKASIFGFQFKYTVIPHRSVNNSQHIQYGKAKNVELLYRALIDRSIDKQQQLGCGKYNYMFFCHIIEYEIAIHSIAVPWT